MGAGKPTSFDELYPGRFWKAGEFQGKKVTFTIAAVDLEDLVGEDGKPKAKATMSFRESPQKGLVMCKTNGLCIKGMFGHNLADWIGKRVTLFPSTWNGEPAIRVWGSPDIPENKTVTVTLPRRRQFEMVMHRMVPKSNGDGASSGARVARTAADYLRGQPGPILARLLGSDAGLDDLRVAAAAKAESEGWSLSDAEEHIMTIRDEIRAEERE